MSTYAYMKLLESTPERYDKGIHTLSRGRIGAVYLWIADRAAGPGRRVLDLGCGTGAVALACAARGAEVVGIDRDAGMLAVARGKPVPPAGRVHWMERSALEIEDGFPEASFDAVTACLMFSELVPEERAYVLDVVRTRLRPGGSIVVADEVLPQGVWRRALFRIARVPLVAWTWLLAQLTTRPLDDLQGLLTGAGFVDVELESMGGGLVVAIGRRP